MVIERAAAGGVWLLVGHKAGDNTQVRALAARLGWPCEEKRIVYQPWELLANRLLQVTLAGIDRARSSELAPPWPDLVISSGRRNEPVARWIKRGAPAGRSLTRSGFSRPMAAGSKTKTSAAMPGRSSPRSWKPNTEAGMKVSFLMASSSAMMPRSRTQ